MILLLWLLTSLIILIALTASRMIWAWRMLRNHPHVEPIEIADPSIAEEMNQLIADVAAAAAVPPPALFIRRGMLPNAFIVAAIARPELYLTDELLERCDQCENGLNELTRVVCHEIAHIKRGDALRLGLLTWCCQFFSTTGMKNLAGRCTQRITGIEQLADKEADRLMQQLAGQ